ncbi:MAG: hypothetical protein ILP08_00280, partial [Lachnospiraceae bacterium]|nr:hypothetical protein [Lachnospiraceae bacterium]
MAGLILIFIQLFITVFCVSTMFYLIRLDRTRTSKMLFLNTTLIFFMNLGYLLELISKELSELMIGIKIEYLGTSFVFAIGMIFVLNYSGIRLSIPVTAVIISWHIFVLVLVWTYGYHDLFYSNAALLNGFFEKDTGTFYFIETLVVSAELVPTLFFSTRDYIYAKQKRSEDLRARRFVFIGVLMVVTGEILFAFSSFGNFDPIPMSEALLAFFFLLAIRDMGIFSEKNLAHDRIIKTLDEPVIIIDNEKKLMEANEAARSLFPSVRKTKVFSRLSDKRLLDAIDKTNPEEIYEGGRFFRPEVMPFGEGNEEGGTALILFDVTMEHKHIERARELKEEADRINSTKSAFLQEMSSKIKKPLYQVEDINREMTRFAKEKSIVEYSNDIKNAVSRLKETVSGIEDLSRIEKGELKLNIEPFDLKEVISNVVNIARPLTEEKGLSFRLSLPEELPDKFMGDALRLWQVLNNLISNALKYTEEGFVSLSVFSEKLPSSEGKRYDLISVAVEDSGIGVRKADRDSLFEKFRRIEEQRNHEVEGSGLGLSLAAEYLALMGSGITV